MADIAALLTLPTTSKGLEFSRSSVIDYRTDGSASPRRKAARLDTDSDIASSSRSQGKKVNGPIVIRIVSSNSAAPKHSDKQRDVQISLVRRCIKSILSGKGLQDVPTTYETIYSTCRSVVTVYDAGAELYDYLKHDLMQSMAELTKSLLGDMGHDMQWIGFFVQICQSFETQVNLLQSLLTYLDQVYVVHHASSVQTIRELCYGLFAERIFGSPQVGTQLRAGVARYLEWDRDGGLQGDERKIIPELIKYLIAHNQYASFEEHYVEVTQSYYSRASKGKADSMADDPKGFFKFVKRRLEEEQERSKALLPVGTWSIVQETTEESLLAGRTSWLCTTTVGPLMEEKDIATLGDMYILFCRVHGQQALCKAFRDYLRNAVQTIVKDTARDDDMVQRLLELKALADNTLSNAFLATDAPAENSTQGTTSAPVARKPDQEFVYAMNDAFKLGFKTRRSKPAEMIAKHLDKLMRKGQGGKSDAEFEALLDDALALYRFTEDKDVFRTFYHRSLAKRLLLEKSASKDFEAGMLKKLKEKYDPEFSMGESMFKDLALSQEAMKKYHDQLDPDDPAHNLNVMVLQQGVWPFSVSKKILDLPPDMQEQLSQFVSYYRETHKNHALSWDHALGTATLKARFTRGVKELSVSLYQAVILLLFNPQPEIAFKDIAEQIRLDDEDLRRTLQSLACGKKKVLKKLPPGRDVEDNDVFRFNADFEDPGVRVHINTIQAKVTTEESERTNVSIEGDRKHHLDAAIVRIMKAKKDMTYEQLKVATIEAVKSHFAPTVDAIKKRIDYLVESDYLKRSPDDKTRFLYVA